MNTANERITTVDDGPTTVNERLSTGGPGPEGQADTVTERLSGSAPAAADLEAPAHSANKPEWVDYAVSRGADRADAEVLTKDKLIEQYG
jgi:hypothetical protein